MQRCRIFILPRTCPPYFPTLKPHPLLDLTDANSPWTGAPKVGVQHGLQREQEDTVGACTVIRQTLQTDLHRPRCHGWTVYACAEKNLNFWTLNLEPHVIQTSRPPFVRWRLSLVLKIVSARMKSSELKELVQSNSNSVTHKKSLSHSSVYTSALDSSDVSFFCGLGLVTLLSFATRLYGISEPPHVAWVIRHTLHDNKRLYMIDGWVMG